MSVLYLVRHGQTDFSEAGYHRLSTKGRIQGESLGRHWVDREIAPEHVFVGPRRRHLETAEAVASGFRTRNRTLPAAVELEPFDEYPAGAVIRYAFEHDTGLDPDIRDAARAFLEGARGAGGAFEAMLQHATRAWVRGELDGLDAESFPEFRKRVEGGVRDVIATVGSGTSAAVFTSAGPVSAAVGMTLGLTDERALEVSFGVRNTSTNELLFSGDRLSLGTFNGIDHITDAVLITYR